MSRKNTFISALISLVCISAAGLAFSPAQACVNTIAPSRHGCKHDCRHECKHHCEHQCKHSAIDRTCSSKVYDLQVEPNARITKVSVDYSSGGSNIEISWVCNGKEVSKSRLDKHSGKEVRFDYSPYNCQTVAVRAYGAPEEIDILRVSANIEALDANIPAKHRPPRATWSSHSDRSTQTEEDIPDATLRARDESSAYTSLKTVFPDSDIGKLLTNYFLKATAMGEGAAPAYTRALRQLQHHTDEALDELIKAYKRLPTEAYFHRWLIVDTMARLNAPAATDWLAQIASSELPAPQPSSRHDPEFSPREEEFTIRLAALHGLSNLAMHNDKKAEQYLLELANHSPLLGIQIPAIEGYVRAGLPEEDRNKTYAVLVDDPVFNKRVSRLKDVLKKERHHLLDFSVKEQGKTPIQPGKLP